MFTILAPKKYRMKFFLLFCSALLVFTGCCLMGSPDEPEPYVPEDPNPEITVTADEIIMLTSRSTTVTASVTLIETDYPDVSWTSDDDCVTLIPDTENTSICWIYSGSEEGFATVTATSADYPQLSTEIGIAVVRDLTLTDFEETVTGGVEGDDGNAFYRVIGLTAGSQYMIVLTGMEVESCEVALGTFTTSSEALTYLQSLGSYGAEGSIPLYYQGFSTNSGTYAWAVSLVFIAESDSILFCVEDITDDGAAGDFTYDIDVNPYSGDKQILETLHCAAFPGGTKVDTFFHVYDYNGNLLGGAYDKGPDDGYSRVYLPGSTLPASFFVRVAAQPDIGEGIPSYVDPSVFGSTGDFALYFDEAAEPTVTGYAGDGVAPVAYDYYELANEHDPEYDGEDGINWQYYALLRDGPPEPRILSPLSELEITDGYQWDEDWFSGYSEALGGS